MFRKLKHYYQRATRGYSDRDIWSLDTYLSGWLPKALRKIKDNKQGIPIDFLPNKDDPWDALKEGEQEKASADWNYALDKMIEGFDAYSRIMDMGYEKEIGPYPKTGLPVSEEFADHCRKMYPLMRRDEKIFDEGAALFVKHFGALWT